MRTSTYTAWDRALGGDLAGILARYRAEGHTVDEITYRLRTDHTVTVSRSTVARWIAIAEHEVAS